MEGIITAKEQQIGRRRAQLESYRQELLKKSKELSEVRECRHNRR